MLPKPPKNLDGPKKQSRTKVPQQKLPKRISVGGRWVRLLAKPQLAAEETFAEFAETPGEGFVIYYDPAQSPHQLASAIAHEVAHAVFCIGGLSSVLGEEKEEAVVRAMEYMYIPALKKLGLIMGPLIEADEE